MDLDTDFFLTWPKLGLFHTARATPVSALRRGHTRLRVPFQTVRVKTTRTRVLHQFMLCTEKCAGRGPARDV